MVATYHEQRARLIERMPGIRSILPEQAPEVEPIADVGMAGRHGLLQTAANHHADVCIICGWGDGSLPLLALEDSLLIGKRLFFLLFGGEEDQFAACLERAPFIDLLFRARAELVHLREEGDVAAFVGHFFSSHQAITLLAGCDLVDGHPLCAAGQETRDRLMPLLDTALVDRPPMLGNCIADSFTGLLNAARNAEHLLPAPDIGDLDGIFGQTPVISVAAGPSLGDHIERLRELQDRCVIVACDAVLDGLLDVGIRPHFVTVLERLVATAEMVRRAGECEAIFAGLPVVYPQGREPFGERLSCVLAGDQLYQWLAPERPARINVGFSSGVLSVSYGLNLTRGPVYLVGHDLSSDADQSHWSYAEFAATGFADQLAVGGEDPTAKWQRGFEKRWLPGNAGEPVASTAWWDRFRQGIVGLVGMAAARNQRVVNVNAHHGVGAVINGCHAAPLPDRESLPALDRPQGTLDTRHPERYRDWRERARRLPEDSDRLRTEFRELRDDIVAARAQRDPAAWTIEEFASRASLVKHVDPGNRMAFAYFLRSALTNMESEMQSRRRVPSGCQARWNTMACIDQFTAAVENALGTLHPLLEEIARGDD